MSNCKCFGEFLEKITENLKKQLPEKEAATLKAEWQNETLIFEEGGLEKRHFIPVAYEYQQFKKSGEPYKNVKKDTTSLLMSYCPLCGEKIKKESDKGAV
jgi:hypothetical protein